MSTSPMWLRVHVYEQRDLLHVVDQCSSSAEKATFSMQSRRPAGVISRTGLDTGKLLMSATRVLMKLKSCHQMPLSTLGPSTIHWLPRGGSSAEERAAGSD